jgi:plastocyanin
MKRIPFPDSLRWMLVLTILVLFLPPVANAGQTWQVTLGAQSKNAGKQAMAFLPNELWIYAGDGINWTSKSGESHTVTFLQQTPTGASSAGTSRPANGTAAGMGCNGGGQGGASAVTPSGSSFDATGCVNSGPICDPSLQQSPEPSLCFGWTASTVETQYSVTFPTAGNFKLVCLIHRDMTGVVHVLPLSASLPHNQFFYDDEAADQARNVISDSDRAGRDNDDQGDSSRHEVVTTGELVGTGGGKMHLAIMRFLPSTIHVDVGDTVEWTNVDPSVPHTVTFGVEPANTNTLLGVLSDADADGDREGSIPNSLTIPSPTCTVALPCVNTFNPGQIAAALQDQGPTPPIGPVPQTPLGVTRARVTFTQAGTYNYFCALHDELGMRGKVIVGDDEEDDDR